MTEAASGTADLYAILGVDCAATPDQVRVAYRALAQRFHPDHNPNNIAAEKRMQEINEAFTVLNSPELRREYDRRRATLRPQQPADGIDPRGAGRGPRPYFRGKNWGLHTGADAPPEHIVRAEPTGFNLVVTAAGDTPSRELMVYNDAPFAVRMRVLCSPWLESSAPELLVEGGGRARLTCSIADEASRELRGWRDGGISLDTDDPRVFCPDIRITAIFLKRGQGIATSREAPPRAHGGEPDLRRVDSQPSDRRGWRQRLFGG